jgi:tetratricopeptide (TPR) repeat protein
MERSGYTRELAEFLHDLLEKNPDLPFWNEYVALSAKALETDRMLALAETSAARTGLNSKQRTTIQNYLHRAYLAADKIDKAVEVLRQEIGAAKSETPRPKPPDGDYSYYIESDDPALALMRLGDVLGRREWIDEGIRAVREAPVNTNDARETEKRVARLNHLASELIALKRGHEAEDVLTEALSIAPDPAKQQYSSPTQPETLSLLLDLYYRAGRPDDVLAVLTRAPQWYSRDLANIFAKTVSNGRNVDYVGLFAADALLRKGRAADAEKIVDALLEQHAGYDPAYEYLIKLKGEKTLPYLERLFARDQFEERPLIWKAKLLLDAGKLEEAEKCARQAVSIDPSDGEQGPGRRMIVYAVLADIHERRGDAKEAETLRGAVTAIRHSEEADRLYEAGLLKRAIKMYEEALSHFTDAYCIQSRLALRLAELGDMAGAEDHYRRAYELMPDSFGRVESHCFGCEHAFEGEKAQSIAETIFTELAAKHPEKPQVHYLLGYLRKAEERYPEALPEFRQAVKLDPKYLNAWKELGEVGEKTQLPPKEREAIQFTMLRLDPTGHHSTFHINEVVDLRAAWKVLQDAQEFRAKLPETLLALSASAEQMRKREQIKTAEPMYRVYINSDYSNDKLEPGQVFAKHRVMEAIIQWFNFGLRSR